MSEEALKPKRRIVSPHLATIKAQHVGGGAFVALAPKINKGITDDEHLSIDILMRAGLVAINRTLHALMQDINKSGPTPPSRETIQSLKDVMAMLRDLKKDEKDLLENMTDEELEKMKTK